MMNLKAEKDVNQQFVYHRENTLISGGLYARKSCLRYGFTQHGCPLLSTHTVRERSSQGGPYRGRCHSDICHGVDPPRGPLPTLYPSLDLERWNGPKDKSRPSSKVEGVVPREGYYLVPRLCVSELLR